ncbi:MAG: protein kinase [Clostridiales bacterium]|nr:protein kinase [Clostridiales bacterium]
MNSINFESGSVIVGKWGNKKYRIKKQIGFGGIASVYLVEDTKTNCLYALKISKDNLSINREYRLLKKFATVDMIVNIHEIDDFHINGDIYYFIVLEYIDGYNLKDYIQKNKININIIIGIMIILMEGIDLFHRQGYIFADLKPENIMIDRKNKYIKIIDLGGVVKKGSGIKEFTPAYDRASWKCGDRIAEPSYDIFSIMMIFTKMILAEDINPRKQSMKDIIIKIRNSSIEDYLKKYIISGLIDGYISLFHSSMKLRELYNLNILDRKAKREESINRKIDYFVFFSIGIFIYTIIFIFCFNNI